MKGNNYEIVQRKKYNGYFIRRADKKKIVHHPNNELKRYETKYTSKNGMTWENALKQFNFLEFILPKKRLLI